VGEDSARATFAGLHDSFLAIESLEEAEDALRRCWLSLLSERAIEYRRRRRLRSPLLMAVVAQEHVIARAAGVAFSHVGHRESARVVVELAPPGESAPVTGAETPERFEVPRVPTGGASKADVRAAARPLARWLSPEQAIEVVRQTLLAEEFLGRPADVEWLLAPDGDEGGEVVLVQARPALAPPPPRFDRTAVAESLPDALVPLSRDFILAAYGRAFARYHPGAPEDDCARVLVYTGGRVFADTWRERAVAAIGAAARGRDGRDARWRAESESRRRSAEKALARIARGAEVRSSGRDLARRFRAVERELDAILPLYLLAQDDTALVQGAIARTRARLELPLGTPPALEAGAIDLARGRSRAPRGLSSRDDSTTPRCVSSFETSGTAAVSSSTSRARRSARTARRSARSRGKCAAGRGTPFPGESPRASPTRPSAASSSTGAPRPLGRTASATW
jgi:hypothetical protein